MTHPFFGQLIFFTGKILFSPFKTVTCPVDWQPGPNKDKCFKYIVNSLSWDKSEALCRDYNGHLAALTSVQELTFAQSLCAGSKNGCWVGGRGYNSSLGFAWKWSDDTSHWNESVFPGQPFRINCSNPSCKSGSIEDRALW